MGEFWDADAYQREIFQRAALDPDEPVNMTTLARRLALSVETIRPAPFPGDGSAARVHGQWRIYLRSGISIERKRFALAHEIAEALLPAEIANAGLAEEFCNAAAAAFIAPRRSFARALRSRGDDWAPLAATFSTTESMVALRSGEVTGTPLALVAPQKVRVRGADWGWPPTEAQLRRLAKLPPPPGLRRARLRDDPRRIVLEAEDLEDCG